MAGKKKPRSDEPIDDEAKLRHSLLGTCTQEEANEIARAILSEGSQQILEVVEDGIDRTLYYWRGVDDPDRRLFEW